MQRYPVNKVVPFNLLVPVFGVLASSLMIGEPLIPHMLIGGLICIAGVALVVVKKGS
jgi:O-acetylserine/cysteine efflux transporter